MPRIRISAFLFASASRLAGAMFRCALATCLMAVLVNCAAAQVHPTEYDVEAAYLFNFGNFLQLPTGSQALRRSTFDICILGDNPIGHPIDNLAAHDRIDGRPVRILKVPDASLAQGCDIVFMGAQDGEIIREDLAVLAGHNVLTVGDSPEFLKDGGMIQFVERAQHVRFAINLDAVRKTHLVLSSQLLRVAACVMGGPQPEGMP